ncbi:protein rhomboid [Wyeomyia smithii]|uniref:protein rhomboid n=1 Tax=Wyeomyia smithii TaxID=174621 RepID=UPI002467FB42|nr:protein rhomboid [Wyeomyia smithii]XP_055548383.1 protein rhomboid [Wyeomyia smithii]XP_055548384.1 protein rhomboid [Wyeomyia smithii]XP_055548385.1 protein rhomboid [Wyeomyia smithii]
MEAKSKSARVVPTGAVNSDGTSNRCEAWTENERSPTAGTPNDDNPQQPEDLTAPFIPKDSESESSFEGDRLFRKPTSTTTTGRIYSISGTKIGVKDKRAKNNNSKTGGGSDGSEKVTDRSKCARKNGRDPHCDAKLVDKFVRTNRARRKRKNAKSVLVKLCQCCPWTIPWALLIVSAIQICTYSFNNDSLYQLLIFSPVRQYEIWRFVTYTFLHAGAVHLMLNVIIQIMVAFPLETEQGHANVLAVYFGGVLAGGLGASIFEPTQMVGASAGVYCLLMSHIPHILMNFQSLSHRYFRLVAVLVLCISDVIYSIRHCLTRGNLAPRIGVAAHVSGALCGLLFGFIAYQGGKVVGFRIARYLALLLYCGWIVATVMYNLQRRF